MERYCATAFEPLQSVWNNRIAVVPHIVATMHRVCSNLRTGHQSVTRLFRTDPIILGRCEPCVALHGLIETVASRSGDVSR